MTPNQRSLLERDLRDASEVAGLHVNLALAAEEDVIWKLNRALVWSTSAYKSLAESRVEWVEALIRTLLWVNKG